MSHSDILLAPGRDAPTTSPLAARWSAARADYLAGATAQEACERHGLSLRTFKWRAKKHGWRRRDQWPSAPDAPFVLQPEPAPASAAARPLPPVTYQVTDAAGLTREVTAEEFERICAEDRLGDPDDTPHAPTPRPQSLPADYVWEAPAPPPLRDPDAEPLPAVSLRRQVYVRMEAAIAAGRLHEARGWTRLLINLDGLKPPPTPEEDARARERAAESQRWVSDHLRATLPHLFNRPKETPPDPPASDAEPAPPPDP